MGGLGEPPVRTRCHSLSFSISFKIPPGGVSGKSAPDQPGGSPICLPDDPRVRAELAAPRWTLEPRGVVVESKDEHQNAARQITRCR